MFGKPIWNQTRFGLYTIWPNIRLTSPATDVTNCPGWLPCWRGPVTASDHIAANRLVYVTANSLWPWDISFLLAKFFSRCSMSSIQSATTCTFNLWGAPHLDHSGSSWLSMTDSQRSSDSLCSLGSSYFRTGVVLSGYALNRYYVDHSAVTFWSSIGRRSPFDSNSCDSVIPWRLQHGTCYIE